MRKLLISKVGISVFVIVCVVVSKVLVLRVSLALQKDLLGMHSRELSFNNKVNWHTVRRSIIRVDYGPTDAVAGP